MKSKDYISTTEAASLLGISNVAVFNRIKSGKLKAFTVGHRYILPKEQFEKKYISDEKKNEIDGYVKKIIDEYQETLDLLKNT